MESSIRDIEKQVVGNMMLNDDAVKTAMAILTPDMFLEYGDVYKAITDAGTGDLLVIGKKIGMERAVEVSSGAMVSANFDRHCMILLQEFVGRDVRKFVRQAVKIDDAMMMVSEIKRKVTNLPIPNKSIKTFDQAFQELQNDDSKYTSTGFKVLDEMINGFASDDYVIIAGRPGMGKTSLALCMALYCDKKVGFFSLEMSGKKLAERLFNIYSGSTELFEDSKIPDSLKSRIIINESFLTTDNIYDHCRNMKDLGCEIIFIDYIQLIVGKAKTREREIGIISRELKVIAKELDVPVIALSQLSRDVEKRGAHRPVLSDLRDSGSIEQDADMVMFVYRDSYYDISEENTSEVIVRKNRNGETGTVELMFEPELTKFYEGEVVIDDEHFDDTDLSF